MSNGTIADPYDLPQYRTIGIAECVMTLHVIQGQ